MRKLKELYPGMVKPAFAILWLYIFIVFCLQTISANAGYSFPFAVFIGMVSFVLTYFVFYFGGTVSCEVDTPAWQWDTKTTRMAVGAIFAITLLIFCGYHYCQYPGGTTPDVDDQYAQAVSGVYSDWHPVLHTLLFFTLPLKLSSAGLSLIVFLQILYFCLAFTYLMSVLLRNGLKPPFAILLCVFVWINPYLATYFMFPWKDLAFTVFAVVLIAQYIQIVCTKGLWLEKKMNPVAFSLIAVLCMYMRHNAVLLVAPIVIFSAVYVRKNKRVMLGVFAVMAAAVLLVQGLYAVLNVEKPGSRTLETVGLPATIWCSVMQKTPEALPEDTRAILYEIATQEQYEANYLDGNFNSIKWSGANVSRIDKISYPDVLKYTVQCFVYSPKASCEAFAKLTSMVWGIDETKDTFVVVTSAEQIGADFSLRGRAAEFFNQYKDFFASSGFLKTLFGSYGVQTLVLLAVGLVLLAKNRIGILHAMPLFCYNFGTMLLLSGPDYRFFVYNIPVWLAVLFLMVKDNAVLKMNPRKKNSK